MGKNGQENRQIGAGGSGASVDNFEAILEKLQEYLKQGADISIAVSKLFDGGEIQLLNKILKKYQEDCSLEKLLEILQRLQYP